MKSFRLNNETTEPQRRVGTEGEKASLWNEWHYSAVLRNFSAVSRGNILQKTVREAEVDKVLGRCGTDSRWFSFFLFSFFPPWTNERRLLAGESASFDEPGFNSPSSNRCGSIHREGRERGGRKLGPQRAERKQSWPKGQWVADILSARQTAVCRLSFRLTRRYSTSFVFPLRGILYSSTFVANDRYRRHRR